MFLFFNNADEDFGYMMKGYRDGIITEERLNDALYRILGLKAKLGLDRLRFPEESGLSVVGCQEHHDVFDGILCLDGVRECLSGGRALHFDANECGTFAWIDEFPFNNDIRLALHQKCRSLVDLTCFH